MTQAEFLVALTDLKDACGWQEDDLGQLRGYTYFSGAEDDTITALAYFQLRKTYCPYLQWDRAASALGLSLEDASAIVSAEDRDSRHDPALARALREAVGLTGQE